MKYTKGNWVLSASDATLVIVSEGNAVADCRWTNMKREESEANANLIAAAPRMYEALLSLFYEGDSGELYLVDYYDEGLELAKRAIAKAEGRTP